jgi:ELWxxDGT repeat protein
LAPHLLKDINPGLVGSLTNPGGFTPVGATVFFSANDGVHGFELWKSNGTAAGTLLVKDINPGPGGSGPAYLTNVNGTLFFSASNSVSGTELWKSNGTAAGTVLVKDINPGSASSYPRFLTNVNGTLFFQAINPTNGNELWRSNGTAAGTVLVKDIFTGSSHGFPNSGDPYRLTNVNGTLFFSALDGHGFELWKSNGTAAGTLLVKDINPGSASSRPGGLTNVNGTLFFGAFDGVHGEELWRSNGTAAGTVIVKDIDPGIAGGLNYRTLTNVNGTLFFSADNGASGFELWRSNGAAAGTVLVKDINPGGNGSIGHYYKLLTNVNGTLFFAANNGVSGSELWKSNGTAAGTVLIKDINPGANSSVGLGDYPTNVNGTLFFGADDGVHGLELWRSNGTATGTILVKDIRPGSDSSIPRFLTNANGTLWFYANDGVHGAEPWIMGPVPASASAAAGLTLSPSVADQAVGFSPDSGAASLPATALADTGSGMVDTGDNSGRKRLLLESAPAEVSSTSEWAGRSPAVVGRKGQPDLAVDFGNEDPAGGTLQLR